MQFFVGQLLIAGGAAIAVTHVGEALSSRYSLSRLHSIRSIDYSCMEVAISNFGHFRADTATRNCSGCAVRWASEIAGFIQIPTRIEVAIVAWLRVASIIMLVFDPY